MKQPIRYFSIGLLTASLLLLITYYFSKPKAEVPTISESETIDEMILTLEDEGYRVITESEYISFAVNNQSNQDQEDDEQEEKEEKQEKDEEEEKKDKNKDQDKDKKKKDKDKDKDNKEENEEEPEEEPTTFTLVIEEDMVPSTVSQILEDNNIIESATKFNEYLEDNDYSKYVQIGEFKLSSDMSMKEVAKALTNQ